MRLSSLPPTIVIALAFEPTIPLRILSLNRPIPYVSILSFREMCPEVIWLILCLAIKDAKGSLRNDLCNDCRITRWWTGDLVVSVISGSAGNLQE
jgi:hypothetical protein